MAVPEQLPIVSYVANGATDHFNITFDLSDERFLVVTVNNEIPRVGAFTVQDKDVVFAVKPEAGTIITLARDTDLERETNYSRYDNSFNPAALNWDLDKLWHVLQEQNLVDAKILARIKSEIEWRRTHDFNYDELAQVREKQIFDALKGYTDTLNAATHPNIFQGVIAGVVFARDGKSIQTHLEEILEALVQERENIDLKADQQYIDEQLDLKADRQTTYHKTEVDAALGQKADQATTYTKSEVDSVVASFTGGHKGYTTLALAQAAQGTLPANTIVEVTNDPTSSNNGTYQWNGTTLTKSAYDPTALAKTYTDNKVEGAIDDKVSELFVTSYNLFNPATATRDMLVSGEDGQDSRWVGWYASDYIKVVPNAKYTLTAKEGSEAFRNVAFYREDKSFISRTLLSESQRNSPYILSIDSDTHYIRVTVAGVASEENRMIYKGTDVKAYLPYVDSHPRNIPIEGATKLAVEEISRNEAAKINSDLFERTYNLYDPETVVEGFSLSDTGGELNPNELFHVSDFIPVEGGEIYTASQQASATRYISSVAFYDENKNYIIKVMTLELSSEPHQVSLTAPENAAFARLSCRSSSISRQRMFYKGDIGKEYVPYSRKIKHEYLPDTLGQGTARKGDLLHFTGDIHTPAVLSFSDSYTREDERRIFEGSPSTSVTYEDMLTWWGDLADEFPDYITKELVGYDSSGEYEVHSYHFNPLKITNSDSNNDTVVRPRVMLVAFHIEQMNQLYPYLAMREMCRSWRDSPALAALRFEVEFVVMPYAHPWGFTYSDVPGGSYRMTSEGINTNGDFPFLWTKVEGSIPNGDTPFATQEMRNVKKVAEKFKPHVFLDMHSNFAGDLGSGLWTSIGEYGGYKSVVTRAVTTLYPEIVKVDEEAPTLDKIARFTYSSRANVAAGYAYMLGTTGGLIEIAKNYKGRPAGEGLYNDGLVFGSSMLLSLVTQCIAEYRDNGNPFDEDKYGTYDEILAKYGLSRD